MSKSGKPLCFMFFLISLSLLMPGKANSDTYMCGINGVDNSCTPAELANLISSGNDGDTINIAEATHSWTTYVTIDKAVTISGGGICTNCGETDSPFGNWATRLQINRNTAFEIQTDSF